MIHLNVPNNITNVHSYSTVVDRLKGTLKVANNYKTKTVFRKKSLELDDLKNLIYKINIHLSLENMERYDIHGELQ